MGESDAGNKPAAELPKIWYSRILQSTDYHVSLKQKYAVGVRPLDYLDSFVLCKPMPEEAVPRQLFWERGRKRVPDAYRDSFIVNNGLLVVSPKLRDVLVQFDLGKTALFEVPILQADGETPSDYPPHYILHVAETRDCFVPQASDNMRQMLKWGATEPEPNAPWRGDVNEDRIAVRASACVGIDLWAHAKLRQRIFFSDRLKQAIDAAKVSRKGLDLVEARVLP